VRTVNEALTQTLRLEAAKEAAGSPARLRAVRAGAPLVHGQHGRNAALSSDPYAGSVGSSAIF
jgi:hypothetical protein